MSHLCDQVSVTRYNPPPNWWDNITSLFTGGRNNISQEGTAPVGAGATSETVSGQSNGSDDDSSGQGVWDWFRGAGGSMSSPGNAERVSAENGGEETRCGVGLGIACTDDAIMITEVVADGPAGRSRVLHVGDQVQASNLPQSHEHAIVMQLCVQTDMVSMPRCPGWGAPIFCPSDHCGRWAACARAHSAGSHGLRARPSGFRCDARSTAARLDHTHQCLLAKVTMQRT